MGWTEAKIEDARFVLRAADHEAALERLLHYSREEFGYDVSDLDITSVDVFLKLLGIETQRENGDVASLEFEDRLIPETEEVFAALAPFVEDGSFVLMHGGTNARWRYVFFDGVMESHDEPSAYWDGR